MRALFAAMVLAGCNFGSTTAPGGDDEPPRDGALPVDAAPRGSVFDTAVTQVLVEIDFEDGRAPYTGQIVGFGDSFDISQANIDRVFSNKKTVTIPRTLAAMQNIGAVADQELTVNDLLALAAAHRSEQDTPTRKTYYVLFVGGYFADGAGPNPGVLGVSLGNTGVIAIFKDVVAGSSALPNAPQFVEQTTLIHELGHAIGLVNNGVPLTSAHQDSAHGAHCEHDSCVMYWQNEGSSAMAAFASQYVLSSNTILFDSTCLADVDALTGRP